MVTLGARVGCDLIECVIEAEGEQVKGRRMYEWEMRHARALQ